MLSVSRKSRRNRLAKLWLAGLGLWGGIAAGPGIGLAQDAYPSRLPNAEYTRAVDKIVEREIQQTGLQQPGIQQTGLMQPSAMPEPAPLPPVSAGTAPAGSGNYTYSTTCPTNNCHQGEFWSINSLFNDGCGGNYLTDNHWTMGGNIDASYTVNTDRPKDHFNGPVTWTDRSNEAQLNQAWLYLEKVLDPDKCFDVGGRIDAFFGSNYRFDIESGLEDNINGSHSFYGLALPQFYVTTKYDNVTFKSGHFFSPVGFFGVDMSQNFFNTLPYTYQYGEPFTHTGTLASVQVNEQLNVGGGIIRGWDNFDNTNPNLGVVGTASKTFDDKASLAYVGIYSQEQNQNLVFKPRYLQTLVYSKPVTDQLTYVAQSDFGVQSDAIAHNGKSAFWYGLNQYALYKINDCWSMGANFEWFRDEQGYRVGGFLPNTYAVPGSQARGLSTSRYGYQGNFYQVTVGPKWTPTKNIIVRPNLRFDWFDGGIDKFVNPGKLAPYGDGLKNAQTIFATDFVFLF
jgi:hypothetical protein